MWSARERLGHGHFRNWPLGSFDSAAAQRLSIDTFRNDALAELACSARPRRYVFHCDEIAEAEAQGLPYLLAPRVLSRHEWIEQYSGEKRAWRRRSDAEPSRSGKLSR